MCRVLYHLIAGLARLAVRSGRAKDLEIIVLRHQLAVLVRNVDRPQVTDDDRSLLAAVAQALPRPTRTGWLVTPDTLWRWHRRRVARHWTHRPRRPARPATAVVIRRLAIEMATANATWGYRRIHGELVGLGHHLAPSTVWKILKTNGIEPAPRRTSVTWSEFLHSQGVHRHPNTCRVLRRDHHQPDRSLQQRPPTTPEPALPSAPMRKLDVARSTRCDGLIHEYRNAA